MKRRQYGDSLKLDLDSLDIKLIPVRDESAGAEQRSAEVVMLAAELIRLATKRGRTKLSEEEVYDAVA